MKGFLYWSAYNNIVQTIRMDAAAGYLKPGDSNSCGYSLAKASRDAKADMEEFLISTRQYLATVGDKNCRILPMDPSYHEWTLGFRARRSGDHLYVVSARPESGLVPGDEIVALGNEMLSQIRKNYPMSILWEHQDEREDWDLFLRMFQTVEVFPGDGTAHRVELKKLPVTAEEPANTFRMLNEETGLLTIESFADADAIQALVQENEKALAGCRKLILDLRNCEAEGEAESFLPLLPYLVDRSLMANEVFPDRTIWTSYSKENTSRQIAEMEEWLKENREAASEEELSWMQQEIETVREKGDRVKELRRTEPELYKRRRFNEIEETESFDLEEIRIEKVEGPEKVVILTDVTTCYAGEWLVSAVRGFDRVVTVGRATAGMIDYTNLVVIDYEDICARFVYPISRTAEAKEGKGVAFKGIPADVYIPFTREECTRDRILEKALEIKKNAAR